jgi:glycosyltransferase involved in cell wall biosynthesis
VNLALLYSGNFGFAHESKNTIGLARKLRGTGAKLVFSVRGNRVEALRASLADSDTNIQFAPFAPESQLRARLSCADIHVVSLKSSWTGTVVPSKFFGALAIGRPVLFEGSEDSSIAKWIREHRVGWVLHEDNVDSIAAELLALAESPGSMAQLRHRCYALYQQEFSRSHALDQWDEALRALANSALAASPEFVATIEAGD